MSILDVLADRKIINAEDIPQITAESERTGLSLEQVLVSKGVPPEEILKGKGEELSIPTRALKSNLNIPGKILEYIPRESAEHYHLVPLGIKEGVLEVGIVDPNDLEGRDALNFISSKVGMPYKVFLITREDYERVVELYKSLSGDVTKALSELETELSTSIAAQAQKGDKKEGEEKVDETKIVEDAPVTKIVATILSYASDGNASDIHIEPMRENVRVRFRVDGVLNTSLTLPNKVHSAVVARIKILCNMRLDEKRKPQDGRFSATIENRKIDFRVSTFPTYYGEKIVMRILDQSRSVRKLTDMGLSESHYELIKEAIKRPYGLILISGPTGSGKSTTLYSMLNEVDRDHKNVLSLEDPVEYNMDGVSQSQVHPEIDYTFATGLRTTLRQDPDIIMVGEIRDKETAQLAIQAALTGHLVLSTIHTNNAVGVIPRLIDMGVDPYLIAPTLILAIAQRLVKTLCPGAGTPVPLDGSLEAMVEKEFSDLPPEFRKAIKFGKEMYKISPTPDCLNGTSGRTAVMELLHMDKDIETIILKGASEVDLQKLVRAKGMLRMKEDAILKAFKRVIPFEEVNAL
ncbi:Flp pilus assembly complex ATPase component TadA [Candidatus Parcubacteria bacterium]|nr:Flp pilus assembly complex ATPase component TadA [Candidatus Parcubacteria bacterium]